MSHPCNRFVPSLESLDERLNPSSLDPTSLAGSPGEAEANRELRFRTFAIVDRTQLSEGPTGSSGKIVLWVRDVTANPEQIGPFFTFKANRFQAVDVSEDEVILIGANRSEARDPGLPNSELQATLFIAKQQVPRDRAIYGVRNEVDSPVLVSGVYVDADAVAVRRNMVTTLSADLTRPAANTNPHSFTTDGRSSGL